MAGEVALKKPMSQWSNAARTHTRRLRSGAPLRSMKESMVSRAPGQRAATGYLSKKAAGSTIGKVAKFAGKALGKLATPVAVATSVMDIHDTSKGIMELAKQKRLKLKAEEGTAQIQSAMRSKYPLAGTQYEATHDDVVEFSKNPVVKIPKGQRKDRSSVIQVN